MAETNFDVDSADPRLSPEQCRDCRNGMESLQKALAILERCAKIGADVKAPIAECQRVYGLLQGYLAEFGPNNA